ncbi:hypothetical protein A3216_12630 [Mycobacterium leprae 7935681]|nr:hypothetical protein A3216_12630 [Mycobacterium leprae 7935681]
MKHNHRLVFSNGLSTLTCDVRGVAGYHRLLGQCFFAIGVFTGFSMAGYGMAKHHLTRCRTSW